MTFRKKCTQRPRSRGRLCISDQDAGRQLSKLLVVALLLLPRAATAADADHLAPFARETDRSVRVVGRATVVDGQTLWLPNEGMLVRLAGIDTCNLPQWSFDPHASHAGRSPAPVACGALAMGWLKRLVGDRRVSCVLETTASVQTEAGVCRVGTVDLGLEMLRVGWATLATGASGRPGYRAVQTQAAARRFGMWGTYVLDPDEWRTKAIDRTIGRQPFADWNLLTTRDREISPTFRDARKQPLRRDR